MREKLVRWLVRGPAIGLCAAFVTLGVVWLMFHYKPAWYRTALSECPVPQSARAEAIAKADAISDRMALGKPFELELRDRAVNRWLAALDAIWPDAGRAVPAPGADPAVRFENGLIRVAGYVRTDLWQAILNLRLTVDVSADGRSVFIHLTGLSAGALPIPAFLRDRLLRPFFRDASRENAGRYDRSRDVKELFQQVRMEKGRVAGIELENRFVWFNGRQSFRIGWIEVSEGRVVLGIIPL